MVSGKFSGSSLPEVAVGVPRGGNLTGKVSNSALIF